MNAAKIQKEGGQFLESQRLAFRAVREVARHLREGWTEIQAAKLIDTYLADHGVHSSFHHGFAWFGERSGFEGMKAYRDFMPSRRVLLPGDAYILDVAPIYQGFVADIGYTGSLGENPSLEKALLFLKNLREEIPPLFESGMRGGEIWKLLDQKITAAGYTNAYKKYPFSVLGHKVYRASEAGPLIKVLRFGWQSFWSIASRGIFSQLLREDSKATKLGFWAIEPHLSAGKFGAKFEEILVVTPTECRWLERECAWV